MPYMERLKEKLRNKDVEMITISIDTRWIHGWQGNEKAMKMGAYNL